MSRDTRAPGRVPERPTERRPRRSKYAVEKGLAGSLESTAKGLEQLLESLQSSGFAEGLSSYRTLQAVLVQQKLWALSNQRAAVLPKFRPIARTAEKLHRVFAGYAAVMDTLRKLDELTEATAPPPPPLEGDAEPVVAVVPRSGGPPRRSDVRGR